MTNKLNKYYVVRQWWDHDRHHMNTRAEIVKTSYELETEEGLKKEIEDGDSRQIIIFIQRLR